MRTTVFLSVLWCILQVPCLAQKKSAPKKKAGVAHDVTDPFRGMPFKPGDRITQKLHIPIGKLAIDGAIQMEVADDPDGMFYSFGNQYRLSIIKVNVHDDKSGRIPAELIQGLKEGDLVDLSAKDIQSKIFPFRRAQWWFVIRDFNMDGKPDFAFAADQGFHSNYVLYYPWININGRLVHWAAMADQCIEEVDRKRRILEIQSVDSGKITNLQYRVTNDTTLTLLQATK